MIEHGGASYAVRKGDVFLLPAVIGVCTFRPSTEVSLLEIALPDCDGRAEDKDQKVETF